MAIASMETRPISPQNPIAAIKSGVPAIAGDFLLAEGICTQSKLVFFPSAPYPQQVFINPIAAIFEMAKSVKAAVCQQILQFPRSFLQNRHF